MTKNINLTINGQHLTVPEDTTIVDAARQIGIEIPTLCHLKDTNEIGVCRVCVVEVKGARNLIPSCITKVTEGMEVMTNSPKAREAREMVMNLILATHPKDCLTCDRNGDCELRTLADKMGIKKVDFGAPVKDLPLDDSNPSIIRDQSKCILCRRCVSVCNEVQKVSAISMINRGIGTTVGTAFDRGLADSPCVFCGQCVNVCPTGALTERYNLREVWDALNDPEKHVVIQTAPAIRVSLGEELGEEPGTIVTKKMVSALRKVGFDKVFDTDFTADLTIMEEGHEFLQRLTENGKLPLLTSCSPGWVNYIETFYPEFLDNVSSCKSPQQMFGAVIKTYYAEKFNIDPATIYTVSAMPCTAKKYEANRPEMNSSGYQDVDAVLTTRELGLLIKEAGIDWKNLEDSQFDEPFGEGTGAGVIFGSSGGVMEAALRTLSEVVTGKELDNLDFKAVRGLEGIKEAELTLGEHKLKVAVANGLGNAQKIMEGLKTKELDYHFVEIMACPGGCIGGGGQPRLSSPETRQKRMEAIYKADLGLPRRKSHENPAVQELYKEFLKKPLGEKSHHLLHTSYTPQDI
jgi:iron-only hydrogenase group A